MITFKQFLESDAQEQPPINVDTLEEFANIAGGAISGSSASFQRPFQINYDGIIYEWSGRIQSSFDINSHEVTYYHGPHANVTVTWLRGKKPCLIVRSNDDETPPYEVEVLNDKDFVQAVLDDTSNKEKIIKMLLEKYKEVVNMDPGNGTFYGDLQNSRVFFTALLYSIDAIHHWPELKSIQKSMKSM